MNNIITYSTIKDFYRGIYELTKLGMKFTGDFDKLQIELTGGY